MQWEKALEDYGYYLRLEQGLSENTIEGYQFDVKRLMRYCENLDNNNKPQNVDADSLKDFVYQLSKEVQRGLLKNAHICSSYAKVPKLWMNRSKPDPNK